MHLFAIFLSAVDSPFIVPVAGCIMIFGIAFGGMWSGVRNREIQSQERLAAIARGVAIPPTTDELAIIHGKPMGTADRRRDNIRLAGTILVWGAVALIVFFIVLTAVLHVREVLCGAAAGIIPLGIGVALLMDARTQTRKLAEAAATSTSLSGPSF